MEICPAMATQPPQPPTWTKWLLKDFCSPSSTLPARCAAPPGNGPHAEIGRGVSGQLGVSDTALSGTPPRLSGNPLQWLIGQTVVARAVNTVIKPTPLSLYVKNHCPCMFGFISRAALLTGRYQTRSGIYPGVFNPADVGGVSADGGW